MSLYSSTFVVLKILPLDKRGLNFFFLQYSFSEAIIGINTVICYTPVVLHWLGGGIKRDATGGGGV